MITQVREGCGVGAMMINGACQSRAAMRQDRRADRQAPTGKMLLQAPAGSTSH
jgi:hypothetical protein